MIYAVGKLSARFSIVPSPKRTCWSPEVTLTSETFLACTEIPQKFIEKRLSNAEDRKLVSAIYDELRATGTVRHSLSEDDKTIRELHYNEVLAPKLAERNEEHAARIEGRDDTPLELAVAKSAVSLRANLRAAARAA